MRALYKVVFVAALALALPSAAHAQFRWFGGSSWGGPSWGTYSPFSFYGGPYFGGYGSGYPGWGGYGYSGYGYTGSGYPGYGYPGYGYSGYGYPGYAYSPPPTYLTPVVSYASTATAVPAMRNIPWPATPVRDSGVTPASLSESDSTSRAQLEVRVPAANAEVYIDGVLMKQTGLDRRFVTPALDAGSTYEMEIQTRWFDSSGMPHTQARRISVRAGGNQTVDLTAER